MSPKFNLDRPPISDEEINKQRDFDALVKKFKAESLKKARGDESWWKNKKIAYTAIIAGITVVCTVTYQSIQQKSTKHDKIITSAPKQNTKPAFIQSPKKSLDVPYTSYRVKNENGANIAHHSSTKITVPKNCFVDKNGKQIVGEVRIDYREFNNIPEIIAAGIPMQYDSAGKHLQLESAGMFDIKGFQNNEPVFIQPGKSIKVTYTSNNVEDRFNQYYLDSTKQNWQYLKRDNLPSINQVRESMSAKTNSFTKQNDIADSTSRPILAAIKNTYQQKMEALPRPAKPKAPQANKPGRPIFQIDRDPQDFPELSTFDNVVFEVGEENKNYSSELHQVTWRDIKIAQGPEKGKNYWLNLSAGPRKVSLIVYPVFVGANYDKALALYNSKLNEYNQAQNKRLAEEKRLIAEMEMKQAAYLQAEKEKALAIEKQRQASLAAQKELRQNALSTQFNQLNSQTKTYRLFEVMSFGIYNSDCAKPLPEENITKPVFVSTNNQQVMMPDAVYLVNKSNNTVIGLSPADGFTFGYGNSSTYMLCLFQKNEVFVCDPDLFNSAVNSDKHQFLVKSITAASANLQDFKKALNL